VEKWRDDGQIGPVLEPIDVTVELDGPGRRLSEPSAGTSDQQDAGTGPEQDSEAGRGSDSEGSTDSKGPMGSMGSDRSEGPVFVDASGRRSKKLRRIGWAVAVVCACYAATVVTALIGGNSSAPWLQIPGLAEKKKADTVQIQPAATTSPSAAASKGQQAVFPSVTDSQRVTPRPSGSTAKGASGTPKPGTSGTVKSPTASTSPGGAAGGTNGGASDPDTETSASTGTGTDTGGDTAGNGGQPDPDTSAPESPSVEPSPDTSASDVEPNPLAAEGAQ
jgi:hypothetical protein